MNCFYVYKGRRIDSIEELNDVLMMEKDLDKYGDLVFSTPIPIHAYNEVASLGMKGQHLIEIKKASRKPENYNDITEEEYEFAKPFIGVTTAIQKAKDPFNITATGSAFPQMIRDNYFGNLFEKAKIGNYSDISNDDLNEIFEGETPYSITNQDEFNNKIRNYLEKKWEFQGRYGNAIHDAMQCYMSAITKSIVNGVEKSIPLRRVRDRDERLKTFKDLVKNGFFTEAKFDGSGNIILKGQRVEGTNMISDKDLEKLFNHAESIYKDIRNNFGTRETVDRNGNVIDSESDNFEMYSELMIYDNQDVQLYDLENNLYETGKLSGAIDLLVVDASGTPHFYDYKTSLKVYSEWDDTKRKLYALQLSIYKNILARCGINTISSRMFLSPIQLGKIHKSKEGNFYSEGIMTSGSIPVSEITQTAQEDKILYTANSMLNVPLVTEPDDRDFVTKTDEMIKGMLPTHSYENNDISEERLQKIMEERVAIDEKTNKYYFYTSKAKRAKVRIEGSPIQSRDLDEMRTMVRTYMNNRPLQRRSKVVNIYNTLKSFVARGGEWKDVLYESSTYDTGERNSRINEFFRRYSSGNWSIIDNEAAKKALYYGVIFMKNTETGQIDVVNITNEDPDEMNPMVDKDGKALSSRELLSGAFYDDIREKSKKSLMLQSTNGNIELIRSMIVTYNLKNMFGENAQIGNFHVIGMNGNMAYADNKQLKYTFNTLARNAEIKISKGLKMMTPLDKAKASIMNIHSLIAKDNMSKIKRFGYLHSDSDVIRNLAFYSEEPDSQSMMLSLDSANNDAEMLNALIDIKSKLEMAYSELRYKSGERMNLYGEKREVVELYRNVTDAILNYSNIELRQQRESSKNWTQFGLKSIFKKGYTSLKFDNPGMLFSELLNDVTRYADNCYQNVRDGMQKPLSKVISLEDRMVNSIGRNNATMLFKNREDMWSSLMKQDDNGEIDENLEFKNINDPSLTEIQRGILKDILTEINRYRFRRAGEKLLTDEEVWSFENNESFYWCPIVPRRGDLDTMEDQPPKAKVNSMLGTLKNGVRKMFQIESIKEGIKDSFTSNPAEYDENIDGERLFELHNVSSHETSRANRARYMEKIGHQNIDLNMANSVLQYIFNNQMSEHIDKAVIVAKCATTHLMTEGKLMNKDFESDIKYLVEYVKNKINKEDINDPKFKAIIRTMDMISNIAVKATLGFSPVQLGYQGIQGIFTNASILYRKALGENNSFNKSDFEKACGIVYSDIAKTSSVIELINRLYSINDLSMADYVRKVNDRNNLYSFEGIGKIGMVFSSRPDYYNRMVLFISQMIHDGTFDAYKKENGMLKYDFTKDKRFSVLNDPNADKNSVEYQRQLGLYNAIAKQMMVEGIYNDDGTMFRYEPGGEIIPLPKAYTNQQSEAYKNIADDAYGYYNDEKKAAIHAMWVGKLFMQFKTFFSGKKNQYFMPGGVKVRGSYEHAEITITENGEQKNEKLFMYIDSAGIQRIARQHFDENGTESYIDDDAPEGEKVIPKEKCVPFFAWKGRYQEGIALTVTKLISLYFNTGSWKEALDYYRNNEDETVRAAFEQNMKQLLTDMATFMVVGGYLSGHLLKGVIADLDDDDNSQSIAKDSMYIIMRSFSNSSLDSNIFGSMTSVFGTWTPMSLVWSLDVMKDLYSVLTLQESVDDLFINNVSVMRQFKNSIKDLYGGDE